MNSSQVLVVVMVNGLLLSSAWASEQGQVIEHRHDQFANRMDRKEDQIDRRLDQRGNQIHNRSQRD